VLVLNRKLSRWQGGLLLAIYIGFVIWSFVPRPAAQALLMLP
jgi:Ca2+/Na+ antiporter